ncbi:MAG TPA: energy transducer TonB [Terriglobales bacterium]|nr:energy transducer TonB [Terriglobales bacterium]
MFKPLQSTSRSWVRSQLVSLAIHGLALYLLLRPTPAIFVTPSSVAYGNRGTSSQLVHLSHAGIEDSQAASADEAHERIWLPAPAQTMQRHPRGASAAKKQVTKAALEAARAGSPFGSMQQGPITGHEVRPALPVVFPDPVVSRSEIPDGVEGIVIVEVTIDNHGTVVETKIVQSLGYGIEERVLAAVRNWRFTPATMDGVAIPSQQDVYFHFPS